MSVGISRTADPAGAGTGTTITYSDVAIGVAQEDRIVVVCVGTELTSGSPSSATLDGVVMNSTSLASFGAMGSRIFWLPKPLGTTADIAITFGASQGATTHHLCVYRVVGATIENSGINTSTDMDANAPLTTGALTIRGSGGFIAIAACAADTVAKTWANATEDLDADVGTFRFTTSTRVAALSATAVTCTGATNNEDGALSWILFRPGVIVEAGSYNVVGTDVVVRKGFVSLVETGDYNFSGTDVGFYRGYNFVIDSGEFSLVGSNVLVSHLSKIGVGLGTFVFNGLDVEVVQSKKIIINNESYTFFGTDVGLVLSEAELSITAENGSFSFNGTSANLFQGKRTNIEVGSYGLSGTNVELRIAYKTLAELESFNLSGNNLGLKIDRRIVQDSLGSFVLSGVDTVLSQAKKIIAGEGIFSLTGIDVGLRNSGDVVDLIVIESGEYSFNGSSIGLIKGLIFIPDAGDFVCDGGEILLTHELRFSRRRPGVISRRIIRGSTPRNELGSISTRHVRRSTLLPKRSG